MGRRSDAWIGWNRSGIQGRGGEDLLRRPTRLGRGRGAGQRGGTLWRTQGGRHGERALGRHSQVWEATRAERVATGRLEPSPMPSPTPPPAPPPGHSLACSFVPSSRVDRSAARAFGRALTAPSPCPRAPHRSRASHHRLQPFRLAPLARKTYRQEPLAWQSYRRRHHRRSQHQGSLHLPSCHGGSVTPNVLNAPPAPLPHPPRCAHAPQCTGSIQGQTPSVAPEPAFAHRATWPELRPRR
jgi:hypothetical protein